MYYCEETREFIHPVFFDAEEEAREVEDEPDNGNPQGGEEAHVEFINQGRVLPVVWTGQGTRPLNVGPV
ncbi:unnamed protein product [Discosporangium mesarthrocarpum]